MARSKGTKMKMKTKRSLFDASDNEPFRAFQAKYNQSSGARARIRLPAQSQSRRENLR